MRKCLCASAMLALIVVLGGCGGSKGNVSNAASGGSGSARSYAELRWGTEPFPGPINYVNNQWGQVAQISALALQSLVELEANGGVKPNLLTSWIEHPNGTTYVYHLRSGMRFSDGKPVTVEDVLFSLRRNIIGRIHDQDLLG